MPASSPVPQRWSRYGWGSILAASAFIALTCWWLTQDSSVPIFDAGDHLSTALHFHELLSAGDLLGPFNYVTRYPPFVHTIGAFAAFIGGFNVAAPIIGQNLVFVALLTVGCYQAGKLLFGPQAGFLAAIFALGSPMLIAQFHVFMLEAPETALVAVSIWLILATRRFSRVRISAWAGLAVGVGLLVKEQYIFFVLGILLCAILRGGWRNRRGLLWFLAVAFVVGSPWYIRHLSYLHNILGYAGGSPHVPHEELPTLISLHNLTWYLWSILDYQLLVPLFLLVGVGLVLMIAGIARRDPELEGERIELLAGMFVAWLAITLTPHHDIRYGLPLLPYLALAGTGWIVSARPSMRRVAISVVVAAVGLNTLGTTLGSGGEVALGVDSAVSSTFVLPTNFTFFSNHGYLVAGPSRDGDVPSLLAALRRSGVRRIGFSLQETQSPYFSADGLVALAQIAKLNYVITRGLEAPRLSSDTLLIHRRSFRNAAPCVRLADGTGVFIARALSPGDVALYCPPHP